MDEIGWVGAHVLTIRVVQAASGFFWPCFGVCGRVWRGGLCGAPRSSVPPYCSCVCFLRRHGVFLFESQAVLTTVGC